MGKSAYWLWKYSEILLTAPINVLSSDDDQPPASPGAPEADAVWPGGPGAEQGGGAKQEAEGGQGGGQGGSGGGGEGAASLRGGGGGHRVHQLCRGLLELRGQGDTNLATFIVNNYKF